MACWGGVEQLIQAQGQVVGPMSQIELLHVMVRDQALRDACAPFAVDLVVLKMATPAALLTLPGIT